MNYSQKTQNLIDKLCKIAERKSYSLKKKEVEKVILKTYDLFDLKRPTKIVWYTHITREFIDIAYSAYRASSAYSASIASIDHDFDYSVCNFQFMQDPEGLEITNYDKKFFEYSKLL
jgi:hypothetical protein